MYRILKEPYTVLKDPYERELSRLDPALFKPIPPALQSIWPLLKAIYQQTSRPLEPEKTAPPVPGDYMDEKEAAAYLRLTARQLRDLCRDQNISHARIDYRTYRFKRADLDEWFEAYKLRRKSAYD
jgi:excisionase family DNA binding protein